MGYRNCIATTVKGDPERGVPSPLTRTLHVVIAAVLVGACVTNGAGTDESSPEKRYISDIERYAVDVGGFANFEVTSRPDTIEAGRTMCAVLDEGGSIDNILLEVFSSYDTTALTNPSPKRRRCSSRSTPSMRPPAASVPNTAAQLTTS
jgi:hypothetical protein